MCTEIVYITKKQSIFIHSFVTWCHSFPLCQDFSNPITHRAETDTFSVITEVRQGDRFYQTSAASPDTLTDKQAQMLPFLLSTQPYNRRLGDSVQECKCVCLCVCRLVPLPGGKCWLLMSFFYSFHKTQSHRLNWASDSHSPVSLTVPLSWCVSLSLSFCLWPWKNWLRKRKGKKASSGALWPLMRLYSWDWNATFPPQKRVCVGYLVLRILFCFAWTLIICL